MNIRSVSQSEIKITLGDDDTCNIRTSSDTVSNFCIYNIFKNLINRRLTV